MSNIERKVGLSVRELLKDTYELLAERNQHQEIVLEKPALAEIANDSDWHRRRIGYMKYERVNLFQFNSKDWGVGRGESYGSYPAEPYDSDILALKISVEDKTEEELKEDLGQDIRGSKYFKNSLVFGMADGSLGSGSTFSWFKNPFEEKMAELLKPKFLDFMAQKPEYDKRYISLSTLGPVNTKSMLYKPEFVDFLTETIETVLKDSLSEDKRGD